MNTRAIRKDLMKHHYLIKNIFIAISTWKTLQILIIDMPKTT